MLKEDYCSQEVGKLLTEKGFDFGMAGKIAKEENYELGYPTCTHQMALKWLRDEHKIFICMDVDANEDDNKIAYYPDIWFIYKTDDGEEELARSLKNPCPPFGYEEYSDAVDASILFALENLI